MRRAAAVAVALALLPACATGPEQTVVASTTSRTEPDTTAVSRTTVPTTTTPPTTVPRVTVPPTTRPSTTTTTTTITTLPRIPSSELPPPDNEVFEDPVPTWPHYDPLPGIPVVAALTNIFHPELEHIPAVAVKIDNHPRARPQVALSMADVVFEENVEFLTRFIAIFHSRLPGVIGPIRSARTSDLNVLAAFNRPVLAWSGGNKYVTATVRSAASSGILVNISAQSVGRCYWRLQGRKAPHNLMINAGLRAGGVTGGRPGARPLDVRRHVRARRVRLMALSAWRWTGSTSVGCGSRATASTCASRTAVGTSTAKGGRSVRPTWWSCPSRTSPSLADPRSPEAQTLGSGPLVVHRNGVAVVGTWSRATPTDPFVFADAAGAPIPLASGNTFVELVRA